MTEEERETVERFREHVEFTDSALKLALDADRAGDEERAMGIVWALRGIVLVNARQS